MNQDQNKKTLRHFQCRDYLWEIFEQMSAELECSTDYLINEAMRQYARSRNYGTRTPSQQMGAARTGSVPAQQPQQPAPAPIPSMARPPAQRPSIPSAPPPPPPRGYPGYPQTQQQAPAAYGGGYPAPATPAPRYPSAPSYPTAPAVGRGAPQPSAGSSYPPPPTARPPAFGSSPPPLPSAPRVPSSGGAVASQQLYVIFNGQKIPVNKEEFVIGRGSKTADLPIKDGNISRRHAAVVMQGGEYYMKDLGSTNGVEYQGRRVETKRIEEGDIFQICDYELRFTYR